MSSTSQKYRDQFYNDLHFHQVQNYYYFQNYKTQYYVPLLCPDNCFKLCSSTVWGFPGSSVVKNATANAQTWVRSLGREDPLEQGMATHSSILAGKIPRIEESGKLQPMVLQRVGCNCVTEYVHTTVLANTVNSGQFCILSQADLLALGEWY